LISDFLINKVHVFVLQRKKKKSAENMPSSDKAFRLTVFYEALKNFMSTGLKKYFDTRFSSKGADVSEPLPQCRLNVADGLLLARLHSAMTRDAIVKLVQQINGESLPFDKCSSKIKYLLRKCEKYEAIPPTRLDLASVERFAIHPLFHPCRPLVKLDKPKPRPKVTRMEKTRAFALCVCI
jgi:hypothetical protein